MKRYLPALLLSVACMYGTAEAVSVTQTINNAALENALGGGVTVASTSGNVLQFGTYTNGSGLWGIGPGIVMSTGNVNHYSDGPDTVPNMSTIFNSPGQANLTALAGFQTYDAATLTLNFIAASSQFSFDFVFGSEEYPEYVGSGYNDVFGAFINGTNISYDQFLNPITINSAWMTGDGGTELDGATVKLTTTYAVNPGQAYTLMFGIADAGDPIFDSTVYISNFRFTEGQTVGTAPAVATPEPSTMLLLAGGLGGFAALRRFRRK